jgi:hypothetical protein
MNTVQSQVAAAVAQVFDRLPALVCFSVELEPELVLADVETFPWPAEREELMDKIAGPLLDLMDEEPAARELLQGRTFVRTLH